MARVCSMIRRSARGVRESMRYGLAFYELQGPLFALESTEKRMILFIAEPSVLENYKSLLTGVLEDRSAIEFVDLNRIPLDSLEKIVRDSVAAEEKTQNRKGSNPERTLGSLENQRRRCQSASSRRAHPDERRSHRRSRG